LWNCLQLLRNIIHFGEFITGQLFTNLGADWSMDEWVLVEETGAQEAFEVLADNIHTNHSFPEGALGFLHTSWLVVNIVWIILTECKIQNISLVMLKAQESIWSQGEIGFQILALKCSMVWSSWRLLSACHQSGYSHLAHVNAKKKKIKSFKNF
jgi:hypothetical protein